MSALYQEHFGLHKPPFQITPDTDYFFSGSQRGDCLNALLHVASHEEGIVTVVAEVGSGKTLLARRLISQLPPDVSTVYLANPCFNRDEILSAISRDLGLSDLPATIEEKLAGLQQELLRRHANGERVLLLIDEAHAMPVESLEEVRLLSNLETGQHKLVNIMLFGQPELDTLLADPRLRQVHDRVIHRFELSPFSREDGAAYIDHRLRIAGWQGGKLFADSAIGLIMNASAGRARRINLLADKSMLAAYAENLRQVEKRHAQNACEELPATPAPAARRPRVGFSLPRLSLASSVLAVSLAGTAVWGYTWYQLSPAEEPAAAGQQIALAPTLTTSTPQAAAVLAKPAAEIKEALASTVKQAEAPADPTQAIPATPAKPTSSAPAAVKTAAAIDVAAAGAKKPIAAIAAIAAVATPTNVPTAPPAKLAAVPVATVAPAAPSAKVTVAPVAHTEPAAAKNTEAATRIARKEASPPPSAIIQTQAKRQPQPHPQPLKVAAATTTHTHATEPTPGLKLDTELASVQRIVPFAVSTGAIGPRGRKALAEIVPLAKQAERVTVRGRTDSTGSVEQNRYLAQSRASSVLYAFLKEGIPKRIVKATYCTKCFVASNNTLEGRRTNRRVDIEVVMPAKLAIKLPKPIYSAVDAEEGPALLARLDDQFTSVANPDKRNKF